MIRDPLNADHRVVQGKWARPTHFARTLPVLLVGCGRFWSLPPSRRLTSERKQTKTDQQRPAETNSASPENPCVGGSIPLPGTTPDRIKSTLSKRRRFRLGLLKFRSLPLLCPRSVAQSCTRRGTETVIVARRSAGSRTAGTVRANFRCPMMAMLRSTAGNNNSVFLALG